jgi:hypothetical protein
MICQEYIAIINICTPNFIKDTLLGIKAKTDNNTIIVGNFNIHSHQQIGHADKKSTRKLKN